MTITSRAMRQLDAAIARTREPVAHACLRAERAGLLARHGQLEAARAELADLHAQRERLASATLAAWVCLAEGLLAYFTEMDSDARDRVLRAHAMAVAARARPLLALSAAWLAHLDYVRHDIAGMGRHVAESLQEAAADHHAARARASLVVAEGYHFGERLDLAQPWYERAREHATAEGDHATLGALMHNRAWLSGDQARLASVFDPDASHQARARQALLAAESTGYFDQQVGGPLGALVPVLRAQLQLVRGEHEAALALYEAHLGQALEQGLARKRSVYDADLAWCKLQLGRPDDALADARRAESALAAGCDIDDQAVAHARLAQVFHGLDKVGESERHAAQAVLDLKAHRDQQARVVEALDRALEQVFLF